MPAFSIILRQSTIFGFKKSQKQFVQLFTIIHTSTQQELHTTTRVLTYYDFFRFVLPI